MPSPPCGTNIYHRSAGKATETFQRGLFLVGCVLLIHFLCRFWGGTPKNVTILWQFLNQYQFICCKTGILFRLDIIQDLFQAGGPGQRWPRCRCAEPRLALFVPKSGHAGLPIRSNLDLIHLLLRQGIFDVVKNLYPQDMEFGVSKFGLQEQIRKQGSDDLSSGILLWDNCWKMHYRHHRN